MLFQPTGNCLPYRLWRPAECLGCRAAYTGWSGSTDHFKLGSYFSKPPRLRFGPDVDPPHPRRPVPGHTHATLQPAWRYPHGSHDHSYLDGVQSQRPALGRPPAAAFSTPETAFARVSKLTPELVAVLGARDAQRLSHASQRLPCQTDGHGPHARCSGPECAVHPSL